MRDKRTSIPAIVMLNIIPIESFAYETFGVYFRNVVSTSFSLSYLVSLLKKAMASELSMNFLNVKWLSIAAFKRIQRRSSLNWQLNMFVNDV